MRIEGLNRPTEEVLRSRVSRPRPSYYMISWYSGPAAPSNLRIINALTPAQRTNNTTRGSTPGLIDPAQGEAGGRIPHPGNHDDDDDDEPTSSSGSRTDTDSESEHIPEDGNSGPSGTATQVPDNSGDAPDKEGTSGQESDDIAHGGQGTRDTTLQGGQGQMSLTIADAPGSRNPDNTDRQPSPPGPGNEDSDGESTSGYSELSEDVHWSVSPTLVNIPRG